MLYDYRPTIECVLNGVHNLWGQDLSLAFGPIVTSPNDQPHECLNHAGDEPHSNEPRAPCYECGKLAVRVYAEADVQHADSRMHGNGVRLGIPTVNRRAKRLALTI